MELIFQVHHLTRDKGTRLILVLVLQYTIATYLVNLLLFPSGPENQFLNLLLYLRVFSSGVFCFYSNTKLPWFKFSCPGWLIITHIFPPSCLFLFFSLFIFLKYLLLTVTLFLKDTDPSLYLGFEEQGSFFNFEGLDP